jgi:tRNA-modifying protein YgfZ
MQETDIHQAPEGLLKRHTNSGLLRLTGGDHAKWLQGIVTADMNAMPDRAFWGLMLQRNGKVRFEVIGIVDPEGLWLAAIGGEIGEVYGYLDSLIVTEDVALQMEPDKSLWAIHGSHRAHVPVGPSDVLVEGRLKWLGDQDRVFVISNADQADWLAALSTAGLRPCDDMAWERFRIRSGLPKWSVDYTSQDTPHHAGLFGRAVAVDKGCYVGQEVVCKVEMVGRVSHRLARLRLDALDGVVVGSVVRDFQTGESVGLITSVVQSPLEPCGWAIARVKTALVDKGGDIRVGDSQGRIVDMLRS